MKNVVGSFISFFCLFSSYLSGITPEKINQIATDPYDTVFVIAEFQGHECVVILVKHYNGCPCGYQKPEE